jgi:hypothetical protein
MLKTGNIDFIVTGNTLCSAVFVLLQIQTVCYAGSFGSGDW